MSLTVVMTTYDDGTGVRNEYARKTLEHLHIHLKCNEPIHLHIADDTSLEHSSPQLESHWPTVLTNSNHNGIGASLNTALGYMKSDYWMYIPDDLVLHKNLDLDKAIDLLEFGYDIVRLLPHPNLLCETMFNEELGWWLHINRDSPGFRFATRPFIARNGLPKFPEQLSSYETERLYNEQHNFDIACLLSDGTEWEHIGDYNVGYLTP